MSQLDEIEAIKRLKYRYLRHLDLKEWDALAECLSADATASYDDGKYAFSGREQIMEFLRQALGATTRITSHRCHQAEIDVTGATSATATWALDDVVIDTEGGFTLRGAAFYTDTYEKIGTDWKIKSTGYRRLYEEVESRQDTPSLRLTSSYFRK